MVREHPSKAIGRGAGMEELKALVEKGEFPDAKEGTLIQTDIAPDYLDRLFELVPPETIGPLTVAVDAGNGMDGVILPKIFERLPQVKAYALYWEPDGTFPNHEANPLKTETLDDLRAKVRETGADLGAAFDGDGDRVGFVDEGGEPVRNDLLIALMASILLPKCENKTVAFDTRSSLTVNETVLAHGGSPLYTPVGHALIKPIMMKEDACFGGELSGHYYFREYGTAENSDYMMLLMLQLLTKEKKAMSEIAAPFRRYFHSGEINFEAADKEGKMREVKKRYAAGAKAVTEIDGVRVDFDDWWLSVRASNTEPLLRLNLEAKSKELMEEKKEELTKILSE
jgi:phosphomannomutase